MLRPVARGRQAQRQRDVQADRQTDRQTGMQWDRQTDRPTIGGRTLAKSCRCNFLSRPATFPSEILLPFVYRIYLRYFAYYDIIIIIIIIGMCARCLCVCECVSALEVYNFIYSCPCVRCQNSFSLFLFFFS